MKVLVTCGETGHYQRMQRVLSLLRNLLPRTCCVPSFTFCRACSDSVDVDVKPCSLIHTYRHCFDHQCGRSRHPKLRHLTQDNIYHAVDTSHNAVCFTQSALHTRRYISRSRYLTQCGIFHAVGTSPKTVYFTQSALHTRRYISRNRNLTTQCGIFHAVGT